MESKTEALRYIVAISDEFSFIMREVTLMIFCLHNVLDDIGMVISLFANDVAKNQKFK